MVSVFDCTLRDRRLSRQLRLAIESVIDAGQFVGGPGVEVFEDSFAKYLGTKQCVGVGNGLDALRLSLAALGVGPGSEVIVPAQTFIATWLAVTQNGAIPVPVDIQPDSGNIDPDRVSDAITGRTAAIIAVHLHGLPAALDKLRVIADRHSLFLVEDAAQAHGANFLGRRVGTWGDAAAFSFYPTKNLGALGDAGCVVTSDDSVARQVRQLRSYGSNSENKWLFETEGWNSRLDPIQAAVLDLFLPHLDDWNEARRRYAEQYLQALKHATFATPLMVHNQLEESVWHHFVVKVDDRAAFRERLEMSGVQTDIHYPIPPILAPAMARYVPGDTQLQADFSNSLAHANSVVSLPMHPWLERDMGRVLMALEQLSIAK